MNAKSHHVIYRFRIQTIRLIFLLETFLCFVINRCVLSINKWMKINISAEHDISISVHIKVHCMLNTWFHGL